MNKELFYGELSKDLKKKFGADVENALPWQLHESLSATVMELIDGDWFLSFLIFYVFYCILYLRVIRTTHGRGEHRSPTFILLLKFSAYHHMGFTHCSAPEKFLLSHL